MLLQQCPELCLYTCEGHQLRQVRLDYRRQNGCVQVVVGTTFDNVVNDATKDVLIFFHSSWCDECPAVSKKLQKVAKKVDRIMPTSLVVDYVHFLHQNRGISASISSATFSESPSLLVTQAYNAK